MRFIVTQELRPHDAGIMELGLIYTDKMATPPNQHRFPLHGYCLPQCSAVVSFYLYFEITILDEGFFFCRIIIFLSNNCYCRDFLLKG